MSLAPAATKDGFSYAGDLFAEASGHNRHRRATVAELKDHFKSGSEKDHPAHWFEAQLIHYGLQPSKTKAVARMRLYDAVNGSKLSVPSHITQLEKDLKKEWTKNEREAKKTLKGDTTPVPKASKRKAESSNVDLTVNVGGINVTVSANTTAKKTKTTTAKATTPAKTAKKTPEPKTKTPKAPPKTPKAKPTPKPKPATEPKPKTSKASAASTTTTSSPAPRKQTARRGGIRQGSTRGGGSSSTALTLASPSPPRFMPIQTARRGSRSAIRSGPAPSSRRTPGTVITLDDSDDFDEPPPPPYSRSPPRDDGLRPLGLLNGRYEVECREVTDQWGHDGFSLVLTLDGSQLWGSFDLGIVSGVLRISERPWQSSFGDVEFTWRGRELDGPIIYGNHNAGFIRFLGDGRVEGGVDFNGGLEFEGNRFPHQGTRSEIPADEMRMEWNGYNEREYDRENSSRW
ncbi:hypothetical protein M426DRAFT_177063 [Hypoxylon sp. CI-4A]|nr:hypothetical protein M426DRAFT_177063 [Hypoxylon sp. CI-4A]